MTAVRGWLCSTKSRTSLLLLTHRSRSALTFYCLFCIRRCVPGPIVCGQTYKREEETTSVSCIGKERKRSEGVRRAINDWQMQAWTRMPTRILWGMRRKETDNPLLIFWIREKSTNAPTAHKQAAQTKQTQLAPTACSLQLTSEIERLLAELKLFNKTRSGKKNKKKTTPVFTLSYFNATELGLNRILKPIG